MLKFDKKQGNFEKIVLPPTCVWFYYLFNLIRFHFHLCITGIPADLINWPGNIDR